MGNENIIISDRYEIQGLQNNVYDETDYESYFKGKDHKTNKDVLLRVIHSFRFKKLRAKKLLQNAILDEINLMKKNKFKGLPIFIDSIKVSDKDFDLIDKYFFEDFFIDIDYINDKNLHIIITEYKDGVCLEEYLKKNNKLSESKILEFLNKLIPIVRYLHNQEPPIIYEDLNPNNIYIDGNDDVYFIRYNVISKYMEFHEFFGRENGIEYHPFIKPSYQAPELAFIYNNYNSEYFRKADIYSIGRIIFFMLTGKSPMDSIVIPKVSVLRKDVSSVWTEIVSKSTNLEKHERKYESVDELMNDLRKI